MREILFRAKRLDNGEWIEGFYINIAKVNPYIVTGKLEISGINKNAIVPEMYKVIPKTVGQYTGLTDKNGRKIFEGDILNTTNSNCAIWYVDYKNTSFCCNQGNANYSCVLDEFMQYSDVEVIGNIHDNPELLVKLV